MKKRIVLEQTLQEIAEMIRNYDFLITHRIKSSCFSREGKIGFFNTMMLLLNFAKKTMQAEINHFYNHVLGEESVSKQAVQAARNKVSYTAFSELFDVSVRNGLAVEESELYSGFRLLAVDGSTLMLESTDDLRSYFGQSTPVKNESYARVSMVFDVLNEFIVDAQIAPYSTGERELAMNHVSRINMLKTGKYILLMDRGYWKRELFEQIARSGNRFLLRVPCNASKVLSSCEADAGIFPLKIGNTNYDLRYLRVVLESGEIETLVTNLSLEEVPDGALAELYFMRWGVETKYHELKNLLAIENFTAKSVLSVKQDFFATVLLANFVAFTAYIAQEQINNNHKDKNLKYAYKPNKNAIISALREDMIAIIVLPFPSNQKEHMQRILRNIMHNIIPIRKGRQYPRKEGCHRYNLRKIKKSI